MKIRPAKGRRVTAKGYIRINIPKGMRGTIVKAQHLNHHLVVNIKWDNANIKRTRKYWMDYPVEVISR